MHSNNNNNRFTRGRPSSRPVRQSCLKRLCTEAHAEDARANGHTTNSCKICGTSGAVGSCDACSQIICKSCMGIHMEFYHRYRSIESDHDRVKNDDDDDDDGEDIDLYDEDEEDREEMRLRLMEEELQDDDDDDFIDDCEDDFIDDCEEDEYGWSDSSDNSDSSESSTDHSTVSSDDNDHDEEQEDEDEDE